MNSTFSVSMASGMIKEVQASVPQSWLQKCLLAGGHSMYHAWCAGYKALTTSLSFTKSLTLFVSVKAELELLKPSWRVSCSPIICCLSGDPVTLALSFLPQQLCWIWISHQASRHCYLSSSSLGSRMAVFCYDERKCSQCLC